MKKYLITIAITLFFLSGLLVSAADMNEPEGPDLKITESAGTVTTGNDITFSLTLGAVSNLSDFQMRISLPDGLTYIGGELAEELHDSLGFEDLEWDDSSLTLYGNGENYTSAENTELLTFQCTANGSYLGTVVITLDDVEVSCWSYEEDRAYDVTYTTNVFSAEVNIEDNENIRTVEDFEMDVGTSRTIHMGDEKNGESTKNISYSFVSSNPEIVSVSEDGTVMALAEGSATITATGTDGSEIGYNVEVLHQHSFGEWEIVTEATEMVPGLQTHTCTVCGATEVKVIPQLDETNENVNLNGATAGQTNVGGESGTFLNGMWVEIVIVAVIVVAALIILMIYTRYKDRKS